MLNWKIEYEIQKTKQISIYEKVLYQCLDDPTKSVSNKENQYNQVLEIKSQRGLKIGNLKLP